MKLVFFLTVILVLEVSGSLGLAADKPNADTLIAAAKQATGGAAWDKIVTWHEVGTATAGGLNGTYDSWTEFPSLHNSISYTLGPMLGGAGWDGAHVWTSDSSKQVRVESSQESVADARQDAYRGAHAYFFPGRLAGTKDYAGTRVANGKTYDAVKITPKDADPFEIWFDRTTHRIEREVQLTGDHPKTFLVSDYEAFGGIMVPKKNITASAMTPGTTSSFIQLPSP